MIEGPEITPFDTRDPTLATWHQLIGRAIVSFGLLERVTLDWAGVLEGDPEMYRQYQMGDMKAFAPALRRVIAKRERRLPAAAVARVSAAIDVAESLIRDRNDIAHGWLDASGKYPHSMFSLAVSKPPRDGQIVIGFRLLVWVADVVAKTDAATVELHAALTELAASWPED